MTRAFGAPWHVPFAHNRSESRAQRIGHSRPKAKPVVGALGETVLLHHALGLSKEFVERMETTYASIRIADVGLPVRAFNGLTYFGIRTVAQLLRLPISTFSETKNIGKRSIEDTGTSFHSYAKED